MAAFWNPAGAVATFDAYRAALDETGLAEPPEPAARTLVLNDRDDSADDRGVITRTWEMSLDLLEQRGVPQARALLRLLSVLADAHIPLLMLDPIAMASSPLFANLDALRLRVAIDALASLGPLELVAVADVASPAVPAAADALHLHPLIRDTGRLLLRDSGQAQPALALAARLLARATAGLGSPGDPATWKEWRAFAPHPVDLLATVVETAEPEEDAVTDAARAALRVTRYLAASGPYQPAQDTIEVILIFVL